MLRRAPWFILIAVAAAVWALPARADDNAPISTRELRNNPQRFWARAFVFRDVLVDHAGTSSKRLGKQKTYPFKTKDLGECFVDAGLVDVLNNLPTGKGYIFSGTVYQQRGGLFRKAAFYIVVNGIVTPVSRIQDIDEDLQAAIEAHATNDPTTLCFRQLEEIFANAQSRLLAYSKKEEIPWSDLFDPASTNLETTIQAVRNALYDFENETKTPAMEYFIQLLTSLLIVREKGPMAAPSVAPSPAAATGDEQAVEAAPAEETMKEPAPPEPQPEPAAREEEKAPKKKAAPRKVEPKAHAAPPPAEKPSAPEVVPAAEPAPAAAAPQVSEEVKPPKTESAKKAPVVEKPEKKAPESQPAEAASPAQTPDTSATSADEPVPMR